MPLCHLEPVIAAFLAWGFSSLLHAVVAAAVVGSWIRWLRLPHGRTRRVLLLLVLGLPPMTAMLSVGEAAVFDSRLLLWLPLPGSLHGWHAIAALCLSVAVLSLVQEILPLLRGPSSADSLASPELMRMLEGVVDADVEIVEIDDEALLVHFEGAPRRARLVISRGVRERLDHEGLETVIEHELAHRAGLRWLFAHTAWLLRLLQLHSPAALWAFRELMVEQEILCDRDAAAGGKSRVLAKALFEIYGEADSTATRSVLRRRVDVLLDRHPFDDDALPSGVLVVAALLLLGSLPWIA